MPKIIFFVLLATLGLFSSCNNSKKVNSSVSKTEIPSNQNMWFVGKKLISDVPASPNPEEGGISFMTIEANKSGSFKLGDIVETCTWAIDSQNNLILKLKPRKKSKIQNLQ